MLLAFAIAFIRRLRFQLISGPLFSISIVFFLLRGTKSGRIEWHFQSISASVPANRTAVLSRF